MATATATVIATSLALRAKRRSLIEMLDNGSISWEDLRFVGLASVI